MNTQPQKKKQMQDKPKVQKASPKERKSERSEDDNRREEEMGKNPGEKEWTEWEWQKNENMGKEEMEKNPDRTPRGTGKIMGRGKAKKQKRAGHMDWSEHRRIGGFIIFLLDKCWQ